MPGLLTYRETATRIHTSESTARRLGAAGALEQIRISRRVLRVREASVDRLLAHGYTLPDENEGGLTT
jgi:hypothetical protein